jgi:DNA-directed RNA polymerase subunit RPC12/RpoP
MGCLTMNTRNNFYPGKQALAYKLKAYGIRLGQAVDMSLVEGGFKCVHCHHYVPVDDRLSGVGNRNHCPYCLCSRHLDLKKAGDRLSACKAVMQPIGLALKRSRNKYAARRSGELMLIHRCADCGKLSLNRIAADDDPEHMLLVLEKSLHLEWEVRYDLDQNGIVALNVEDISLVKQQLYG